jgi:hypothetical protein
MANPRSFATVNHIRAVLEILYVSRVHGDLVLVARWCVGQKAESTDGLFRIREDEPTPRMGAAHHKTL